MAFHFRELMQLEHRQAVDCILPRLEQLHSRWAELSSAEFSRWLALIDTRLQCFELRGTADWILSYSEVAVVPKAEWIVAQLPKARQVWIGRPPGTSEVGLAGARSVGVDLSNSRVRVGFSRGHLLEIYVLIPLDIQANIEQLQLAAEIYLENLLGDRLMDDWVAQVAVDRLARTKGLKVVDGPGFGADSYPLEQVEELVALGISALKSELPGTLLDADGRAADWTVLEISEPHGDCSDATMQADRRLASTRFPEALKCCLEGLPFSSQRFTRGEEVFVWLSWTTAQTSRRQAIRDEVESTLVAFARSDQELSAQSPLAVAGTGLGQSRDYLDLWVRPDTRVLRAIGDSVGKRARDVTLGFYDSKWAEEVVRF